MCINKISMPRQFFYVMIGIILCDIKLHTTLVQKALCIEKLSKLLILQFWRWFIIVHWLLIVHHRQNQSCAIRRLACTFMYLSAVTPLLFWTWKWLVIVGVSQKNPTTQPFFVAVNVCLASREKYFFIPKNIMGFCRNYVITQTDFG